MLRNILIALIAASPIGCGPTTSEPDLAEDVVDTTSAPFDPAIGEALGADGPYQAGYREIPVTYQPPGHAETRTLTLSVWYPTNDTSGSPASYLGILEQDDVFLDATLAPPVDGETYPVHIHSHGHRGFAGATPYLMRHFATHGWVVAAPGHTGNTLVDNLDPRPPWMYVVRGLDISRSLDTLAALPPDDPLGGRLDTTRVLMSGHSFGGYTAYAVSGASFDPVRVAEVCATGCTDETKALFESGVRDARVVAVIPMAAGNRAMFGDRGYGTVAIPILMMTGDDDESVSNSGQGDPIWEALSGKDAIRVDVAGGCHQLFGLGACHDIDDDEGFRIVKIYALAFGRSELLNDETVAPVLDGTFIVSDKVTFSSHMDP